MHRISRVQKAPDAVSLREEDVLDQIIVTFVRVIIFIRTRYNDWLSPPQWEEFFLTAAE